MPDVYVDNLSSSLGELTRSVLESSKNNLLISAPELLSDAGFAQHHICEDSTTAYDLAFAAVSEIDRIASQKLKGVDAIIYSTCIPANSSISDEKKFQQTGDVKYLMDFAGSHLQADFELTEASVFGLTQQACTGMLGSLRLAKNLINAEDDIESVLCVTADRFPLKALYEQAYCLISDGAAACVVSKNPSGFKILGCQSMTNGAMALASDDETVGSFFNHSHALITRTVQKLGLSMKDVDWIVPQNTNRKAWKVLASLLRFDFEKVYFPTLPEAGHVISGDNIINLQRLSADPSLKSGDKVMLFMAGYGLNWQCVILEKV